MKIRGKYKKTIEYGKRDVRVVIHLTKNEYHILRELCNINGDKKMSVYLRELIIREKDEYGVY